MIPKLTCKEQFTDVDIGYIAKVLDQEVDTVKELLLYDSDTAGIFMSENFPLIKHIIMWPEDDISIRLFTYAAVRVAMTNDRHRATDERLTDYVAEMVVSYVENDHMHRPAIRLHPSGYLAQMEKGILNEECRDERFHIHRQVALFTLCLLGINPEYIYGNRKIKDLGSPSIHTIEKNGKKHLLSAFVLCGDPKEREMLQLLASHYTVTRLSLNLLAEHNWLPVREDADVWS